MRYSNSKKMNHMANCSPKSIQVTPGTWTTSKSKELKNK